MRGEVPEGPSCDIPSVTIFANGPKEPSATARRKRPIGRLYSSGYILLKTLAYVRDIDGLTLYFDFQCFTSPPLVGDENQFWPKITKPSPAEITKPQPGNGFEEEC